MHLTIAQGRIQDFRKGGCQNMKKRKNMAVILFFKYECTAEKGGRSPVLLIVYQKH